MIKAKKTEEICSQELKIQVFRGTNNAAEDSLKKKKW
jgi:hypothetical protein